MSTIPIKKASRRLRFWRWVQRQADRRIEAILAVGWKPTGADGRCDPTCSGCGYVCDHCGRP